ncbi:MAG: AmmeMemoRadiSam system protein B [Candidatus Kerfeldbacteria bacterium RIFCSPHIGHO2_02_FULL_42_14]|uniref:AmmeMemoRadiSam system protein B n=1 Tax=Candidatus Kerfeldbacteria bacterium RIFCSPHIGHO2_02_FULL_42_14 TaxID=1798540 RepID=A0A1G2AQ39_9BACT|nr:MAG: AmmeMemoRadiSam system protein B [Candidatus Kerfeldbacteria bacterium RIFCSPHIGHO2_02_FULL_42_14]OGY80665.1 MAG: AmmeMemoRadiSam system protein B [Candidatus Kerfeldbacteria bacterium RIFCSPHIGHO2_12_FULL_42_13]OGY82592.1 MAG: AmmeMemoRadiSam system protein B [Candidatus Kerfeldbacteria bacterium RIFCSPLOWO2_02_FULL_42_19]OGY85195.1 MAG: AmmeMemoRadiSam system protein B [Candidatus Kerfeldbacteria bacterium RIFCSPLOWO2_12_FULL_43_9]
MALIFGAITPHPPLLLPSIGKGKEVRLTKTIQGFRALEEYFYTSKPDTVIIISPHGPITVDNFYMNVAERFRSELQDFGDMSTNLTFSGDIGFVSKIKEKCDQDCFPVKLLSQEALDYGTLVPLFFLTQHTPNIKIVPISYSWLDYELHYRFGVILQQEILNSSKRIAVIASGDLSHRLTKEAPAGFSPHAQKLDETIIEAVQQKDKATLLHIDPLLVKEGNECGLRSLLILLGIFNSVNYQPVIMSYEYPFGIGYLIARFDVQ